MITTLLEYEGIGDMLEQLLKDRPDSDDVLLDPEFEYTMFSDELLELLTGGKFHESWQVNLHIGWMRSRLKSFGIAIEYAEGIAVLPAVNLLVIFYDQPEPTNELQFQDWAKLLVRGLPKSNPGQ